LEQDGEKPTAPAAAAATVPATAPPVYPINAVHLMRTTQSAQLRLSAMADQKASILMGASFVIFTITIGQAHGTTPPLPLLILGGAAFLSAICAVLCVLPAFRHARRGPANILFFGSFTQMSESDFTEEIISCLRDEDTIYRTIARDIYQNGCVLQNKKYRMLGWAYRIFLAGLAASATAFVVEYVT
jgi:hypothetical protein